MIIPAEKVFELMNSYGNRQKPFLFGIDFEVENGFFLEPDQAERSGVFFNINGIGNVGSYTVGLVYEAGYLSLQTGKISFDRYNIS